jgi:hypothetical protein
LRRVFHLPRDGAAHQVAQREHRLIGDAVISAGAATLALHQSVLGQQRQMARDIGGCESTQLSQVADVALAPPQQVEDLQARRLRQHLEVVGNLGQRFGRQIFHE